jgi:two-component system cell cycle sensor histidine kinase/response regulator CckA
MDDLAESETFHRSLFEHAGTAMVIIDEGMTISMVNREAEILTGYTREDMVGKIAWNRLIRVDRAGTSSCSTSDDPGPMAGEYEAFLASRRGETKHVLIKVNPLPGTHKIMACLIDISEEKEGEASLQKNEERYRNIMENMGEGFFEVDLAGTLTFVNKSLCRIFGYSRDELMGLNNRQYTTPETADKMYQIFNHVYRTGRPAKVTDYEIIRKNGKSCFLEVSASLLRDSHGNPVGFRGMVRDVTAQKTLEAQLTQGRKMEAIGTLAGGIAHNFNNLLMGIQGHISLMLLDTPRTHPHFDRLTNVERLIENGSKLTGQLLGYARGGKYEARLLDLNRLVKETSQTFGLTKKEITIHMDLSPDLKHVTADRGQMEEVLMNLFVNAADAMPKGGDLFLATQNVTERTLEGKPFKVEPGDYALITVRDTGSGMDRETMDRIFDPFFTTKPVGRGTGLGLASVYGIIKGHHGYIDVESTKGVGTCFRIYLPSYNYQAVYETPVSPGPIRGAGTLLVVDDEEAVLKVARLMLEKLGYRVLAASSSKEAMDLFTSNKENIDMVILDMIMPDMGGGLLYEKLKGIDPGVKALLSSGYSIDGQAMEILNKGCSGFIQKPFTLANLSRKVRDILG